MKKLTMLTVVLTVIVMCAIPIHAQSDAMLEYEQNVRDSMTTGSYLLATEEGLLTYCPSIESVDVGYDTLTLVVCDIVDPRSMARSLQLFSFSETRLDTTWLFVLHEGIPLMNFLNLMESEENILLTIPEPSPGDYEFMVVATSRYGGDGGVASFVHSVGE